MMFRRRPEAIFPLRPPLPLPPGIDEATLYDFLSHVRVRDASEQEMKARVQEMRAKLVESEAQIPMAIAEAFRSGHLGVLDYYNMQNIQADTNMRKSIADGGAPDSGAPPAAGATQSTS